MEQDPRYFRPTEVDFLQGDSSKAGRVLGWRPEISFEELVGSMVEPDLELALQERTLRDAGHPVHLRGGVQDWPWYSVQPALTRVSTRIVARLGPRKCSR